MVFGCVDCGPNKAIFISGCGFLRPKLINNGRVFVWPCQTIQSLDLNAFTVSIDTINVRTRLGVVISVTGVVQIKVSGDKNSLQIACDHFLGKESDEILRIAKETLVRNQRVAMGNMTAEEIYFDRKKFSVTVFEAAEADLQNFGLQIVSYRLQDVRDNNGYFRALGRARTVQAQNPALDQKTHPG